MEQLLLLMEQMRKIGAEGRAAPDVTAKLYLRLLKWHTDTHDVTPVDADSWCLGVGGDRPSPDQEVDDPKQGMGSGLQARRPLDLRVGQPLRVIDLGVPLIPLRGEQLVHRNGECAHLRWHVRGTRQDVRDLVGGPAAAVAINNRAGFVSATGQQGACIRASQGTSGPRLRESNGGFAR